MFLSFIIPTLGYPIAQTVFKIWGEEPNQMFLFSTAAGVSIAIYKITQSIGTSIYFSTLSIAGVGLSERGRYNFDHMGLRRVAKWNGLPETYVEGFVFDAAKKKMTKREAKEHLSKFEASLIKKDWESTYIHEAGHALAAYHYDQPIIETTISPEGGHVTYITVDKDTESSGWANTVICLAGAVAEQRFSNSEFSAGAVSDITSVNALIDILYYNNGYLDISKEELTAKAWAEARQVVAQYEHQIKELAKHLRHNRRLSGTAVLKVIEKEPVSISLTR